jgi:MFS family permease
MGESLKLIRFTREVSDVFGRRYRVGESAEELTGRPRAHQAWRAWLCLAAISPLQYLFGFAVLGLPAAAAWGRVETMWLLAVFVVVQACTAVPVARLNRRRKYSPAAAMVAGGVLASAGLFSLGHASGLVAAMIGYSGLGGIGAGLVYSTAAGTAAKWFPDNRVSTIGFVTGGFAFGAVPSILALTLATSGRAHVIVYDVLAVVAVLVVALAGAKLVDPPPYWWPPDVDPRLWAIDSSLNRSLPRNVPAVREYGPGDALRTPALPLMWLIFAVISGVSLFGTAFVGLYAVRADLGMVTAGVAAAALAAVSGLGRSVTARLSDRVGRAQVLGHVLLVEGVAQLGLALSGGAGSAVGFALFAMLAGLGAGAFYAIFANLVLEYFGQHAGGVVGVGGGALLVSQLAYAPVFVVAGGSALGAAALVRLLKQPGRPTLPLPR